MLGLSEVLLLLNTHFLGFALALKRSSLPRLVFQAGDVIELLNQDYIGTLALVHIFCEGLEGEGNLVVECASYAPLSGRLDVREGLDVVREVLLGAEVDCPVDLAPILVSANMVC